MLKTKGTLISKFANDLPKTPKITRRLDFHSNNADVVVAQNLEV